MLARLWRNMLGEVMIMTDKEKLDRLRMLAESWKVQRDKFAAAEFQQDLTTIQYIVYASHVAELEGILNA